MLQLVEIIVIKFDFEVVLINEWIIFNYGFFVVDFNDRIIWKYYLNVCGEYYSIDEVIYIILLDIVGIIVFIK